MSGATLASPHVLRIARIVQETADARSFVLDVPPALRERFAYRAGQFLTFQVPWGPTSLGRSYSLSSSPETDADWIFTVKRVAEGRVSNWFHDGLHEGDVLQVLPPAGRFVLDPKAARPLVLFGGGSGITPLFSILKTTLAASERRVRLVYANRAADSIIFRDALAALAARHGARLTVVHHLDAERGFMDAAGVRAQLARAGDADFYLCGPAPFMELVESVLRERGVARERIHIERFDLPTPLGPAEPDLANTSQESSPPESITVHLEGETHVLPYAAGDTILLTARKAGLNPPSACEESYCGCCMAKLVQGTVSMAQCQALDAAERNEGWILPCQAKPTSEVCEVRWE